jgi:hypothetical protein
MERKILTYGGYFERFMSELDDIKAIRIKEQYYADKQSRD